MAESVLKISKLAGSSNWDLWSIRMQAVLTERGYLDIMIDPPNPEKEQDPEYIQKAAKAAAYIRLALADGPLLQTRNIANPFYLWGTLKNLYESKGFSSEFLICKELFNIKLSNTDNLEDYLANIRRLTDDLKAKNIILPDRFIAAYILNNLTKDYENTVAIITQSIRSNSTIDLEELSAQLIDESRRLKYKNKKQNNIDNSEVEMALSIKITKKKNSNAKSDSNNQIICEFCGLNNHTDKECFKKHPELRKSKKPSSVNITDQSEETSEKDVSLVTTLDNTVNFTSHSNKVEWILDSGASIHIASKESYFKVLKPYDGTIKWGNSNTTIKATGIGNIEVIFPSTKRKATIYNCLLIPEFKLNLLSLGLITEKGLKVEFNKGINIIDPAGKLLTQGYISNNISSIETSIKTNKNPWSNDVILSSSLEDPNLWHKRLGHIGEGAISKLPEAIEGLKLKSTNLDQCTICPQAQITKKVNKESTEKPKNYLNLVYSDIGGPISPKTPKQNRYYITFLDAAIKWLEIYLISKKGEAFNKFKAYVNIEGNNASSKLKRFHSDNAKEYLTPEFDKFCIDEGILHTTSAPYLSL